MNKLNKKGFTLVELLAVIVILGVIMLIAIPSIGTIISNSRQNSFISSGKMYISTAQNYVAGELNSENTNYCMTVATLTEGKADKSPINTSKDITGYVLYNATDNTYKAYIDDTISSATGITSQSDRKNMDTEHTSYANTCPTTVDGDTYTELK